MDRHQSITRTISAPADRQGNVADTGYRPGERVELCRAGECRPATVIAAAAQPYEYMANPRPGWERDIVAVPALRVQCDGDPFAVSVPVAWLRRMPERDPDLSLAGLGSLLAGGRS